MQYPTWLSSDESATGTIAAPWAKSIVNIVKGNIFHDVRGASVAKKKLPNPEMSAKKRFSISSDKSQMTEGGELKVIDVKKIAEESRIDVELIYKEGIVKIDRETFQKVRVYQPPAFLRYLPSAVQPLVSGQYQSFKVLKSIPNEQLFVASVFAGALTEIIRAVLFYPLSTIKSRVQARKRKSLINSRKRSLQRKLRVSWLTFLSETKRGDLYAGLLPTLRISVPSSGVYSGAKEVSALRRSIPRVPESRRRVSLLQRTRGQHARGVRGGRRRPRDTHARRRPVAAAPGFRQEQRQVRLRELGEGRRGVAPRHDRHGHAALVLLLSRIFLNAAMTTSCENLGQYEFETITIGEWNSNQERTPHLRLLGKILISTLTNQCNESLPLCIPCDSIRCGEDSYSITHPSFGGYGGGSSRSITE
jgi:hypothetical protein